MKTMLKFNLKSKKNLIILISSILMIMLCIVAFKNTPQEITLLRYDDFLQSNSIQSASIDTDGRVIIRVKNQKYYLPKEVIKLDELAQKTPINIASGYFGLEFLLIVLFIISFYLFLVIKNNRPNSKKEAMQSAVNLVVNSDISPVISNITFKDVAGIEDAKIELMEIVDFLKNPKQYIKFGIKMPKGVLMVGPPGVGKTLIAKAVAGEANVPFFYQNGASFVQIYVGMGAKRVRELFSKARAYAPSIVFIDEIDAVGKARGDGRNDEREATLNQLLTQMDGFEDNGGVIVIAATNKIEMIDEALLRSGRFDRRIFIGLPDFKDRQAILNSYLKNKNHSVDIAKIARNTTGFSGAALATLVNEAAINALRNSRVQINDDDFKAVQNNVIFGKKRIHSLTKKEKEIQALYQAAKALTAEWFGVEFDKISLLEDRFISNDELLESSSMIISKIKVCLAGNSALKIYKNELYTNSINDLNNARALAGHLTIDYAMRGNLMANANDVKEILDECSSEVDEFIRSVKSQLFLLMQYLIEHESIDKNEIKMIIKKVWKTDD